VPTILSRDTASSVPQGIRATLLFGADGLTADHLTYEIDAASLTIKSTGVGLGLTATQ
jgi:hypothetical protein